MTEDWNTDATSPTRTQSVQELLAESTRKDLGGGISYLNTFLGGMSDVVNVIIDNSTSVAAGEQEAVNTLKSALITYYKLDQNAAAKFAQAFVQKVSDKSVDGAHAEKPGSEIQAELEDMLQLAGIPSHASSIEHTLN